MIKDLTKLLVQTLWCAACRKFEAYIKEMKNIYTPALLAQKIPKHAISLLMTGYLSVSVD